MYNWTKDDIKKKIALYEKAIDAETDPYKKAQMAMEVDFDKNSLFNEFNDINIKRDSLKKKLFNAYNIHLIANRYVDLALDFHNGILKDNVGLFKALHSLETHQKRIKRVNDKINYSYDEILAYTNLFYSRFDGELYKLFLESYNQRFDHVNFSTIEQKGDYLECGYCFYLFSEKANYINLLKSSGIDPVYTAIHEFGHAIANSYNPKAVLYDNKTTEVSSFFPEFVALDQNITGAHQLIRASKDIELLTVLHDFASSIYYQNQILYIWSSHNYKTDFGFYLDCFQNGFSYAGIKESFLGDVSEDLTYATSAYITFYFLSLYRKDPKFAINKYKDFLKYVDKDDVLYEFISSQVRDDVYGEIEDRIASVYDTSKKYGGRK